MNNLAENITKAHNMVLYSSLNERAESLRHFLAEDKEIERDIGKNIMLKLAHRCSCTEFSRAASRVVPIGRFLELAIRDLSFRNFLTNVLVLIFHCFSVMQETLSLFTDY